VYKSPIVFFKISENQAGENDLVLTPGFGLLGDITQKPSPSWPDDISSTSVISTLPLMNQTYFDTSFAGVDVISGSAPRWVIVTKIVNPINNQAASAVVLAADLARENVWNQWPLFTCVASSSSYDTDKYIDIGDRIGSQSIFAPIRCR
jgi:hypothetical protein